MSACMKQHHWRNLHKNLRQALIHVGRTLPQLIDEDNKNMGATLTNGMGETSSYSDTLIVGYRLL
jgi:hypothetical protein